MRLFRAPLSAVALLATLAAAMAHDPGLSTGRLHVFEDRIEAEITFARADFETVLKLDANGDGTLSAAEISAAEADAGRIAGAALSVRAGEKTLVAQSLTFRIDDANNVLLSATFPSAQAGRLSVRSVLIERMPRGHRQFMSVLDGKETVLSEVLLRAGQDGIEVDSARQTTPPTFREFFVLGVEHIVTGYDHLLFLFALLFVVPGFRQAALIITSFTIAHSITLGAATLNWVSADSRFVEPLIALSIVYVGVENLVRRDAPRGRWLLTFAFGLIHGFGFAGVLRELGVSSGTTGIAMPLVSFNLGVEAGQIAIAAVALPIILALRTKPVFIHRWVPALSTVVIAMGVWWLAERTVL